MPLFICRQCGIQFGESPSPPGSCPICEDDRQYVRFDGQAWTTLDELQKTHKVEWETDETGIVAMQAVPHFAIGQRALLVPTPHGNVLWDMIALINAEMIDRIQALGGIKAIAISHPHYYTTMTEWSEAFGNVPVYIHAHDRDWAARPPRSIVYWTGDTRQILPDVTLIRCGGHFPGAAVMHWAGWNGGAGAVFSGDTLQVAMDRKSLSFMYSFPNYIPLDARTVSAIGEALAPFRFDRVYGAFWRRTVHSDGKAALARSVERYIAKITQGSA